MRSRPCAAWAIACAGTADVRRLLWCDPPWRALVAGWLAAGFVYLLIRPALPGAPPLVITTTFVLLSAAGGGVAALRARLSADPWTRAWPAELLSAVALAAGLVAGVLALLAATGQSDLPAQSHVGAGWCYGFLAMSGLGFLALRGAVRAYRYWDHQRRHRFAWALTDALLRVILAAGLLGLGASLFYGLSVPPGAFAGLPPEAILSRLVIWAAVLTLISAAVTAAGLLLFLPLSAAFSYWIARRLTRRLEDLTRATTALQRGDLTQRVTVSGEDEVALLQAHFNRMADDLERSTAALQAERDKVAALLQSQRELTAAISHELRTPAAVIAGYADALRRDAGEQLAGDRGRDFDTLAREAQRLQAILNDLLTVSQAEAGRLSLTLAPVDLGAAVQRAVETFAPLAWEGQKVQVVAEVEPGLPLVPADELRLGQVLANLLHNALRHTPPGGVVAVAAARHDGAVRLSVSDTGEGIPPEDLPHIWDRFYQSSDPARRSTAGAGLGLALVKELSEAMGATVGVESVMGEGSTFWVEF